MSLETGFLFVGFFFSLLVVWQLYMFRFIWGTVGVFQNSSIHSKMQCFLNGNKE